MQPINNSKKAELNKSKTMIFVMVSVASLVLTASLVVSKGLWSQASYLNKVATQKEVALNQLEANKASVSALVESYKTFSSQNPNLLGGSATGKGEKDGSNDQLVLDALPSKYDFPAVASSLEKLLFGYTINSIAGTDDSIAQQAAPLTGPVEIPFVIDTTSNYGDFKDLIRSFNKSIRPIQIVRLNLNGTNSDLQTEIEAKTYYQPELGIQIEENQVP